MELWRVLREHRARIAALEAAMRRVKMLAAVGAQRATKAEALEACLKILREASRVCPQSRGVPVSLNGHQGPQDAQERV